MTAPLRAEPGVVAGLTPDMIAALVHAVYARVRRDRLLGPALERTVGGDWDNHLGRAWATWSSILLMGVPLPAGGPAAPALGAAHFARWLELFAESVEAVCPPSMATFVMASAETIGRSLGLGLAPAATRGPPVHRAV